MARTAKKAARRAPRKSTKKARPQNRFGKKPSTKKDKAAKAAFVSAAIEVDVSEDVPTYYSNYIEVAHARHDFALHFSQLPAKLSSRAEREVKETGRYVVEPLVKMIVAPTLIPALIRVLQTQQEKYESVFGKIVTDQDQQED